jgi:hypothetical protein
VPSDYSLDCQEGVFSEIHIHAPASPRSYSAKYS